MRQSRESVSHVSPPGLIRPALRAQCWNSGPMGGRSPGWGGWVGKNVSPDPDGGGLRDGVTYARGGNRELVLREDDRPWPGPWIWMSWLSIGRCSAAAAAGGGGSGCVVDRDERELIAGKRARRGWVRTVSSLVDRAVGQDQQGARVLRVLGKGEPSRAPRCCPPPRRCTSGPRPGDPGAGRGPVGIAGLHPHTLRHTFATTAVDNGVEVLKLDTALRHATPTTTNALHTPP